MGLNHLSNTEKELQIQAETFGHLAPKPNKTHQGWILFSLTTFGDTFIIEFKFNDLESNPWFNTDVLRHIGDYTESLPEDKYFGVFKFRGTYIKYEDGEFEFKGIVNEINVTK